MADAKTQYWRPIGKRLEQGAQVSHPSLRVYLTGRVSVEAPDHAVFSEEFPGQQGRLVFTYLTLERGRPVTHGELAEALWAEVPVAWETALSAIVSKLRSLVARLGVKGVELRGARGCYELRLPPSAWVDVEAAADAMHEAEVALKAGRAADAYGPSAVAHHVARRPFLPGERSAWAEGRRDRLRDILLRALEARAEVYLWNDEHTLALQSAKELVALEPFRESGHRLVMRALGAMGNTAEALRAYENCRKIIVRELGVDPSPQTKAEYETLLRATL